LNWAAFASVLILASVGDSSTLRRNLQHCSGTARGAWSRCEFFSLFDELESSSRRIQRSFWLL